MQMRTGVGWQYALTDLSLILFLVSASGLAHNMTASPKPPRPDAMPVVADPVAVWRAGVGAPSLGDWIASQPRDPRQRLTVIAHYKGHDGAAASTQASALLSSAGKVAGQVRIVIEPGASSDLSAALTWDADNDGVGQ